MSNTSNVSPYDSSFDGDLTANASSSDYTLTDAVNRQSLAEWLWEQLQPSAEELAQIRAVEQTYQQQFDALEAVPVEEFQHLSNVTTLNLHLNDLPQLLNTARQIGYTAIQTPDYRLNGGTLLQHADGSRIAVSRNAQGCLRLHSIADAQPLHNLIGHFTQNQVLKFLNEKGMKFESVRLSTGELQILAQEQNLEQSGGSALIKAQVQSDGTTWIDIDLCKGNRCETIVQQFATAIGGRVIAMKKKDSWFQLPGEPTKTQVKSS
ncbi:hypothetical protein [Nitrosomonas sp. wSCUT-2]